MPEPGPGTSVPGLPRRPAITRTAGANPYEVTSEQGEHYDAVRPSYPVEAVDWVLAGVAPAPDAAAEPGVPPQPGRRRLQVVDLGAGTGLATRALAAHPAVASVVAVEPASAMRAVLEREVAMGSAGRVVAVAGTAEATGLPAASADVVVAAQAWHWVDVPAASLEAARVLRPGGRLTAVWNQLDVTVPWVHRLTRIMRSGDVHAAAPEQRRFAAPFGAEEHARWDWSVTTTPAGLHALMASRSAWLRASETARSRMARNLDWYLGEHLGHGAGSRIVLPYVTVGWRARTPRHRGRW